MHALVFVEIRVFKKPVFVSRVPTHTSTWNQGIDVEDFGVLNTKSLEPGLFVVKENQVIIRVGYKVFFRLILESYKLMRLIYWCIN